jgi:hypothetical protein
MGKAAWYMVSGVSGGELVIYTQNYPHLNRKKCDFRSRFRRNRCNRYLLGRWLLGMGEQIPKNIVSGAVFKIVFRMFAQVSVSLSRQVVS